MKIPFLDLAPQHRQIRIPIERAIKRVIRDGGFILGRDLSEFEKEFALFCSSRFAVGVSSGTDALFLALLSANIGKGDEVIVPAFTYIATALAVSYTGAKPVFVDINERTYNLEPSKIERSISRRTKAIIAVHLYGQPADMRRICGIAGAHRIKIIEDAAQAHGAGVIAGSGKWKTAGSIGMAGCFSFYPTKNLGALGDGGMVTTDSGRIYKKLLMLRDYGRVSKYRHTIIGYNARLDTLQAAVLREKLKKIRQWNALRCKAADIYNRLLLGVGGITVPFVEKFSRPVYHVYAVRAKNRQNVLRHLTDKGVGCIIHYPVPVHLQKAYRFLGYKKGDFPVSEQVASEILSLPIYPHITKGQIEYICREIKKAV